MRKTHLALLSVLYFFSRIFFITPRPIFFDSAEYLMRFQQVSYFSALILGHIPLHSGYPLLFWPVFHLAQSMGQNPAWWLIFGQVVLSFLTLNLLYRILLLFTKNDAIAFWSVVLFALTPLYWIANGTMMMETTYITFFVTALFCITKYVFEKKATNLWLVVGGISLGWSLLTHPLVILWLPLLCVLPILFNRRKILSVIVTVAISFFVATSINILLIAWQLHSSLLIGFQYLYLSKWNEQASVSYNLRGMLVFGRNFFVPLLRNNSVVVVALGLLGGVQLFRRDKKLFIVMVLWVGPALLANQWWDTLFFGRHALIAGVGVAFLAVYFLHEKKVFLLAVTVYLFLTSWYALSLLHTPVPYLQEAEIVSQLPTGGLLIESHFARPQTQGVYNGEMVFVDEPDWGPEKIAAKIHYYLAAHKPVFVSGPALSEPYGMFSGPYLHELSLSYAKPYHLQPLLKDFTAVPYKSVNTPDNIVMYQIDADRPAPYPEIRNLKFGSRRIDYGDPFLHLWQSIAQKFPSVP